jgi:hypothetical protein
MRFKSFHFFQFIIVAGAFMCASVFAEIPQTVNFQGFLTDQNNQAVEDASYSMTFSLWDGPETTDNLLWSENQNVQVSRGIYSVALGSSTAFPNTLTFANAYYLGVQVAGGDYLKMDGNLVPLTTTWTAFRSQTAAGRTIKTVSDNYTVLLSDDIVYANGDITITLPSATGCDGKIFTIENIGTGSVSIQTNGSQNIDDDSSMSLGEKYAQVTLVSNGSGWYRLGASGGASLSANNVMTGSLTVDNATASTSTTSGALVVSGGVGISEKLYVGDDINTTGDISADNAEFSDQLSAGDTTINGELTVLDGESGTTVIIQSTGTGIEIEDALEIQNGTSKTGIAIGAGAGANSTTASTTTNPKIAIGYNAVNNLGGNTALIRGKLYLDGSGNDPIYYRDSFGSGDWTALEVGGGEIVANSVGYTELAAGSVRTTELADDAVTVTKIAGENGNGKVITTDGSGNTSWDYVKNAVQEFTVKSGETITAGDIVTYVNGTIQKGVGGKTSDFSMTTPYTMWENTGSSYHNAVKLSDSKFIVCSKSNSTDSTLKVGTLSGTSISWGDPYSFSGDGYTWQKMGRLDNSKVVIAYRKQNAGNKVAAIIAEISGNVISFGTEEDLYDSNHAAEWISLAILNNSKFAVVFSDDTNSTQYVVIGEVNATTITHGNAYTFDTKKTNYHVIGALSETKIVVAYYTLSPNTAYCIVGNITGTDVSWGDRYTYNTAASMYNSLVVLNDSQFLIAYQDVGNSSYGTAIIGEVNGTTVSYGTSSVFKNENTSDITISKFDETSLVIAYQASNKGYAVSGNISGTNITFGNEQEVLTSTFWSSPSCEVINDSQFVVIYRKGNDSAYASIGSYLSIYSTGIASTGGTAGENVKVVFSGVVDNLSGLSANTKYYADDNGNLTTTETERFIGTALSTTSLLIQSALPGAQTIEDGYITAPKLSASGGSSLGNGNISQVLQSNGDGTFQWSDINESPFTEAQSANLAFAYTIKNGFNYPMGIAVDNNGKIYVADTSNHQVQVFSDSGAFEYSIASSFNKPADIAINSSGKIYVADSLNGSIKVFSSSGVYETTIGAAQLSRPEGIAIDHNDKIYVTDMGGIV